MERNSELDSVTLSCTLHTILYDQLSKARLRAQSRIQVKPVNARPRSVGAKSGSITSMAEIMSTASYISKDKKKFPKELIKLLETALKRVVMRQEPAYDEVQLRGSFGAFYAYFVSDAFQKTMKDNRKLEDLILMFYSKATGELQKRLSDVEFQPVVMKHVIKFVQLLLSTIKTHKLASDESDLVYRLKEYETKLTQCESESVPLIQAEDVTSGRADQALLDVGLSSSPILKKIQKVFNVPERVMLDLIDSSRANSTDDVMLRDTKLLLKDLQTQGGIYRKSTDFAREEEYRSWRQQELTKLTNSILKLANDGSVMAKAAANERSATPMSATEGSTTHEISPSPRNSLIKAESTSIKYTEAQESLHFVPLSPLKCFGRLVELCFADDRRSKGEQDVDSDPQMLTTMSWEIIQQCKSCWRVSESATKVILLDVCCNSFMSGLMDLEDLDSAFTEIKGNDFLLHFDTSIDLSKRYKNMLKALHDSLFRDLYTEVQNIYQSKINLQSVTFMDEHIYNDPSFADASVSTARMFDELEAGLRVLAEHQYRATRDHICPSATLEILHIVKLVDSLLKDIATFRKRYRKPLLGVINVWSIYSEIVLVQFLHDVKPLLEQCYRNARAQDADFAIEDMFTLYRSVSQVCDMLHAQISDFESPISLDLYFRPFALKWLQQAHVTILTLVPRLLQADKFQIEEAQATSGTCHSESVALLFKCFTQHLAYLRALEWPDEYWNAKFVTSLTHTFRTALQEYCSTIQRMFVQECLAVQIEPLSVNLQSITLQQRLVLKARDAINKRHSVEPFHINSEACVKLNNVEWAKSHLDHLEHDVGSEKLSEIISSFEGEREAWTHGEEVLFVIKILSAENLSSRDNNDYSDAYVVLSDQKGKRIGKTRTVLTNQNPHWDESFDLNVTESLWLAATVWDRDSAGEHDICGRSYFKVDPRYFEDGVPKLFPLELNGQGILNVRITMEIETNESTFHFSRAFRYLHRAEKDMCRVIIDKMTPSITVALSRHNMKTLSRNTALDGTIGSAYSLLNKAGISNARLSVLQEKRTAQLSTQEIEAPIVPLMQYLDDNFKTLDTYLTRSAFLEVLVKLWNFVLSTVEDMIVPELFSKHGKVRRPLVEEELDICYKWLGYLKDTFAGDGGGLSEEELKSPQYQDLLSIRFFYFDRAEDLIAECEQMAAAANNTSHRRKQAKSMKRRPYNLGTIKIIKEERRLERRQLASSEDIILRVLRQRPDSPAQRFVERRMREKFHEASRSVQEAGMIRNSITPSK